VEDPTAPLQEQGNTKERQREKRLEKEAVSGIFNIISTPVTIAAKFKHHKMFCLSLSGRTMALGSTQLLTEMSTRNISFGVNAACA